MLHIHEFFNLILKGKFRISEDMEEYLVSILVPIFGTEKYIERCAISLFEQTYKNIEYIFVDDCSPDRSVVVLRSVIAKYPIRKKLIRIIKHDTNMGLGAARNTGIQNAKGFFVMHVDSDDYLDKHCIEKCVKAQTLTDADILCVSYSKVKKKVCEDVVLPSIENPIIFNKAIITHTLPNNIWGKLIKKSLYTDFDISVQKGINMSEDLNVLPKLLYYSKKVSCLAEPLYMYECDNSSSYTSSFSINKLSQIESTLFSLSDFFKNRNGELLNAVHFRAYVTYVDWLVNSCKNSDKMHYEKIREKINGFSYKGSTKLNFLFWLIFNIHNYYLCAALVKSSIFIKRLFVK